MTTAGHHLFRTGLMERNEAVVAFKRRDSCSFTVPKQMA